MTSTHTVCCPVHVPCRNPPYRGTKTKAWRKAFCCCLHGVVIFSFSASYQSNMLHVVAQYFKNVTPQRIWGCVVVIARAKKTKQSKMQADKGYNVTVTTFQYHSIWLCFLIHMPAIKETFVNCKKKWIIKQNPDAHINSVSLIWVLFKSKVLFQWYSK